MSFYSNKNKKQMINISTFSVLMIIFIIINLFIYSIISIGLYKLICYENTNKFFTLIFSEKYTYVYYSNDENIHFFISDFYFYSISVMQEIYFCDNESQFFFLPSLT